MVIISTEIQIKPNMLLFNNSFHTNIRDASKLSATQAREKILEFADNYSFETVCLEIVNRMTGDEAREVVEHFQDYFHV
jgi:hypothetical protein